MPFNRGRYARVAYSVPVRRGTRGYGHYTTGGGRYSGNDVPMDIAIPPKPIGDRIAGVGGRIKYVYSAAQGMWIAKPVLRYRQKLKYLDLGYTGPRQQMLGKYAQRLPGQQAGRNKQLSPRQYKLWKEGFFKHHVGRTYYKHHSYD